MNDPRYETIKPMFDQGKISSFLDIFKYISKTRVAKDMGKNENRFIKDLDHLENWCLPDLFRVGDLCGLSRLEILELLMMEFAKQAARLEKGS